MRFTNASITFLLVYMDNIIITCSDYANVTEFTSLLNARFTIKYIGFLHYFLGIEVTKLSNGYLALS